MTALAISPRMAPVGRVVAGDYSPAKRAAKKIIVIGAGLAGLSAAYELVEAGHDVTILEARTRPGGRVFTMREPFADGLYAEAGTARQAAALEGMRKVFPGLEEQYEGGSSKAWDADEWSRGAYAWFRPGEMTSLLPHIGRPEGRIHFAGEHASSLPGWMEGALESGSRAADEILNS